MLCLSCYALTTPPFRNQGADTSRFSNLMTATTPFCLLQKSIIFVCIVTNEFFQPPGVRSRSSQSLQCLYAKKIPPVISPTPCSPPLERPTQCQGWFIQAGRQDRVCTIDVFGPHSLHAELVCCTSPKVAAARASTGVMNENSTP